MIKALLKRLLLREKSSSRAFIDYWPNQGVAIGKGTYFYDPQSNCLGLNDPFNLSIGSNVRITHGVTIVDHGYDWCVLKGCYGDVLGNTGQVSIGNNVFVGMNAIILKNVSIGDNVIIGAGSVVTHDIPANSVAAGNPCRVLMSLSEYRDKRAAAQLNEALSLFRAYRKSHSGKVPPKEIFREYFWLFERPGKNGFCSCEAFDRVMHLIDDSFELSISSASSKEPMFNGFEEFIKYCCLQDSKVNLINEEGDNVR